MRKDRQFVLPKESRHTHVFRNLTLFRFPKSTSKSLAELDGLLDDHRLRPCGPIELATRGFVRRTGVIPMS